MPTFFCQVIGWREIDKPASLAGRGGVWLQVGDHELHLGVDPDFRAAAKAHPAFATDRLDDIALRLENAGIDVFWDDRIPGLRRFFVHDPVGNRLEFLEAAADA